MATPQAPRHCFCLRRRSYKEMVQDIADNLGSEDVQKIVFLYDLPNEFSSKPALVALRRLEMQGQFSDSDTERLESLLKSIHRYDLINKHVLLYRRHYSGCDHGPSGTSTSSLKPLPQTTPSTSHEQSLSTRLKPAEKREIRDLLKQYVPREVMRRSTLLDKFSLTRITRKQSSHSEERLNGSYINKDGPDCTPSTMSLPLTSTRRGDYDSKKRRALSECLLSENELEWIVVDTNSVTDSGTCSGGSFNSSLDIDIGDLSKPTHEKTERKAAASSAKTKNYFTWRVKRSEFMHPLFEHTNKTFEKKLKLCLGSRRSCPSVVFKLFPNGVGSDENIYSSFRIELPSATQILPSGTALEFSITVRDLHTADVLVSRHMEVAAEQEEYMLEQFLAHEVIKSSKARHFEIKIMIKVKPRSGGWVEISQH